MSGDFLLDTNVYQAYNSLDLLRLALSRVAGPPTSDPSDHQPGGASPFDIPLGQLDWDKNAVAEIAGYAAAGPAAPGTGATSRLEDDAAHLDDAIWITQQPGFSATQGMDKLTEAVKDKAADVAAASTTACETVLSKPPTDPDYAPAQQVVEAKANEMAEYVQQRIGQIPRQVLSHVQKHNAPTVELRAPPPRPARPSASRRRGWP